MLEKVGCTDVTTYVETYSSFWRCWIKNLVIPGA
jgi:hypothetical protein